MAESRYSAADLIEFIHDTHLHTMTKRDSGKLHEMCKYLMIEIEEYWMKWDDPQPR